MSICGTVNAARLSEREVHCASHGAQLDAIRQAQVRSRNAPLKGGCTLRLKWGIVNIELKRLAGQDAV